MTDIYKKIDELNSKYDNVSDIDGVARVLQDGETAKCERVIGKVLQNKIDPTEHTIECVVQCRV